jgi:DNA-directed RNA polymerase subunit RPC12/RpoP
MFKNRLEFKGAVIGMMLGDGCIPSLTKGRKTQYFTSCSKLADKEYAEFKRDILSYLNETKITESSTTLNNKVFPNVIVRTLSHPFYNKLYEHMYYDKRKTVTEHVMKCLTPLGLALWYMDDGVLAGEMGWRNPFICSHAFNQVENELLCRMIHKKFGVTFRTIKKNSNGKTYYWMRLRRKDRDKFFDIIREYVPSCMLRKIDPSFYENDKNYTDLKKVTCVTCSKEFEVKKFSIAKNCHSCNEKSLRKSHVKYYDEKKENRKFNCLQCSKEFTRKPGKLTMHCSKICSGKTHSKMWKNKRSDAGLHS